MTSTTWYFRLNSLNILVCGGQLITNVTILLNIVVIIVPILYVFSLIDPMSIIIGMAGLLSKID